jgi:outer membrane receptor for ferrienterochelin and colicins
VLLNAARTPLDPADLFEGLAKVDGSLFRALGERHRLRGGLEWVRDEYRGRTRIRDAEGNAVTTRVAWGQYDLNPFRTLTITTGVRYDDHSLFGTAISPKVAVVERVTDWLTARGSFGRGFRAPDVGQLYFRFLNPTNLYQVIGNPHLEPERSSSWQVGVESRTGSRAHVGLNVFRNDVMNLIQAVNLGFVASPARLASIATANDITPDFNVQLNRLLFLYKNVAHVRTRGVELSGDYRIRQVVRVSGTYAHVNAIDANTRAALSNRNPHQGTVRVDWTPARSGIRANLRGAFYSSWIAGSTRSVAGTSDIYAPGFALWDLTVSKTAIRGAEVFGAVNNLTNSQDPNTGLLSAKGSALPIFRPEIGRTFQLGLRWSWSK